MSEKFAASIGQSSKIPHVWWTSNERLGKADEKVQGAMLLPIYGVGA